jgi:mycoredoxin
MNEEKNEKIILYTSRWCAHSRSVEGYLSRNDISVQKINIDGNQEARRELIEINRGYASVPTLIFPDGTKLTEPSISTLRGKLDLETPAGLREKIWAALGQSNNSHNP